MPRKHHRVHVGQTGGQHGDILQAVAGDKGAAGLFDEDAGWLAAVKHLCRHLRPGVDAQMGQTQGSSSGNAA